VPHAATTVTATTTAAQYLGITPIVSPSLVEA